MAKFMTRTRKNATVVVKVWRKDKAGVIEETNTIQIEDAVGKKTVEVEVSKQFKGCLTEILSITFDEVTYRMPTEKFYELAEVSNTSETTNE